MIKFKQLRCSFCGKKDSEVLKLVAGPRVYICDGCIAIATRLMNSPPTDDEAASVQSSLWHKFVAKVGHFIHGSNALRVDSPIVSPKRKKFVVQPAA